MTMIFDEQTPLVRAMVEGAVRGGLPRYLWREYMRDVANSVEWARKAGYVLVPMKIPNEALKPVSRLISEGIANGESAEAVIQIAWEEFLASEGAILPKYVESTADNGDDSEY